jgi:hypothetical protein
MDPVPAALGTDVILRVETKVNGGGRLRTTPGSAVSLVAGHWYSLATTFAYESSSSLLVSALLEDWGTDGSAYQSTVLSLSPTSVSLSGLDAVLGDADVWAGFRDFHEGGANLTDNFSAVPEPATLAWVALALLAGRRTRSN